jgi:penicillin amidase
VRADGVTTLWLRHTRRVLVVGALLGASRHQAETARAAAPRDVRIVRDDYGVPHVYADDLGALFFGFGHAVAQDRLFQLEMTRRSSWGTVAEVLGPEFVKFDTDQRRVGYTLEQVRSQMAGLAPEYRTMLKAYADGVNDVIESIERGQAKLPPEFDRVGFRPPRWTDADVAQIFIAFMATRYSDGSWGNEARNAAWLEALTARFGPQKGRLMFEDLVQKDEDPETVTTIPRGENWRAKALPARRGSGLAPTGKAGAPRAVSGVVPPGISEVAARIASAESAQVEDLRRLGVPDKLGSYSWIIGASRTLNGSAILLGGPQMGFYSPGYLHEVGLHGAGFDVVGSTPIGHLPVLFGHNASAAWSATSGGGDPTDLFVEKLDPKDPTRYQFKGESRPMEVRPEVIKVKGAGDVKETFYRSVHGPIQSVDAKNGVAYARGRGFANLELESMAGWIDKTRAETYEAFVAAARRNALSITWLYADRKGNIGVAVGGHYPRRHPDQDRRLPTPGTGEREWVGFMAPDEVPHALNPARGFFVNWNNLAAAGWDVGGGFSGRTHRSKLIIDFFEKRPVITVEDVKESVRYAAFVDGSVPYFRPLLLDSVHRLAAGETELQRAANIVAAWDGVWRDGDGDGKYDDPGVTIFDNWYRQILTDIFTDASVGPVVSRYMQYRQGQAFGLQQGANVVLNILEGKRSPVSLKGDYLGGATPEAVMVGALRKVVDQLRGTYGAEPAKWLLPVATHDFETTNYLDVPQGYTELPKIPSMRRGSENHIVVLSPAGVRGVNVVPPGESGVPPAPGAPSAHFADQVRLLLDFDYKPMHFSASDVEGSARSVEHLSYPYSLSSLR